MKFSKVKLELVREKDFDYNYQKLFKASEVVKYIKEIEGLDRLAEELCFVVCLDIENRVLAYSEVAKGGTEICPVDMKSIFKISLMCNSSRIIVIHNHPSGSATPSKYDLDVTKKIKKACELMNVTLLDHIVVGESNFCSCLI
ncbi:MAG: JAB domain-containing protein [Clostridia bacterium]|jgi:DNA repair protein RadC|nr:JAB domain-containing protein [Clostridia bacterium]